MNVTTKTRAIWMIEYSILLLLSKCMYALWISRTERQGFTPCDNVDHEDYEKSLLVSSTGVLGTH